MKQLIFLSIAVTCIFSFSGCGGSETKTTGIDSAAVKKASLQHRDKKHKHTMFADSITRATLEKDGGRYEMIQERFEIVPIEKFIQFNNDFNNMFNNGTPAAPINNLQPIVFSIYEKFQNFQGKLGLQAPVFTDPGTQIDSLNVIRIYPAIDAGKNFYLVFMREHEEIQTTPSPYPPKSVTSRSIYYTLKAVTFDTLPVPPETSMADAEADIKRFQTTLANLDLAETTLTFKRERSFCYSIDEYDELLSAPFPFWGVDSEKINPFSSAAVRIFPGIDKDDTGNVRFRLMVKLYRVALGGVLKEVAGKAIFDNMDICPDKCPENEVK